MNGVNRCCYIHTVHTKLLPSSLSPFGVCGKEREIVERKRMKEGERILRKEVWKEKETNEKLVKGRGMEKREREGRERGAEPKARGGGKRGER